ncbi:hypothetical protein PGTUg99_036040 [Puccinia graminis f. sp. tritici]|uniref:Uncharacterized protein n=1 Tax=Puccinia graminis f. sp. tritici TaxID=56615 RepID=A0A5B0QV16_PUCGR|nr:hypothetical protein PGTUg99_036040 [Puccinia graminis f. sp. tritici]
MGKAGGGRRGPVFVLCLYIVFCTKQIMQMWENFGRIGQKNYRLARWRDGAVVVVPGLPYVGDVRRWVQVQGSISEWVGWLGEDGVQSIIALFILPTMAAPT